MIYILSSLLYTWEQSIPKKAWSCLYDCFIILATKLFQGNYKVFPILAKLDAILRYCSECILTGRKEAQNVQL